MAARSPEGLPGEVGGCGGAVPLSARQISREALNDSGLLGSSSVAGGTGPLLRRKLYDQNLSDWSARYKRNKQTLDTLSKECDVLRNQVAKHQAEVDDRAETLRQLDERCIGEVLVKSNEAKSNLEMMTQQKNMLAVQLSENRKVKAQVTKLRKLLQADFERKHAELLKTAESRDRLDAQVAQLTQNLAQLGGDRRRMERELEVVQSNLRANTELADEVHGEIEHVFDGIKDVLEIQNNGIGSISRLDGSISSREGHPTSPQSGGVLPPNLMK